MRSWKAFMQSKLCTSHAAQPTRLSLTWSKVLSEHSQQSAWLNGILRRAPSLHEQPLQAPDLSFNPSLPSHQQPRWPPPAQTSPLPVKDQQEGDQSLVCLLLAAAIQLPEAWGGLLWLLRPSRGGIPGRSWGGATTLPGATGGPRIREQAAAAAWVLPPRLISIHQGFDRCPSVVQRHLPSPGHRVGALSSWVPGLCRGLMVGPPKVAPEQIPRSPSSFSFHVLLVWSPEITQGPF